MPLVHSASKAALKQNMETLHADIGKSPHVQSQKQAVAIALNTQREARRKHTTHRAKHLARTGTISNKQHDKLSAKYKPASAGDTDDIKSKTSME